MSSEVRRRITLGIGIPLAALLFIGILVLAFSRILLAVPESLAPWIALLFAANILVGCTLAANVGGTRGFAFLIGVLVATVLFGGVAAAFLGERPVHSLVEEEHAGPEMEPAAPPPGETPPEGPANGGGGGAAQATLAADNLTFDAGEISLPAGGEATILFRNQEAQPHNVAVYTAPPAEGGEPIFQGEVVTGPTETEYRFPSPEPGSYHFQCDVHPTTMSGTLTVE